MFEFKSWDHFQHIFGSVIEEKRKDKIKICNNYETYRDWETHLLLVKWKGIDMKATLIRK